MASRVDEARSSEVKARAEANFKKEERAKDGAKAMNELAGALEPGELQTLEKILTKILVAAGDAIVIQRVGNQ